MSKSHQGSEPCLVLEVRSILVQISARPQQDVSRLCVSHRLLSPCRINTLSTDSYYDVEGGTRINFKGE